MGFLDWLRAPSQDMPSLKALGSPAEVKSFDMTQFVGVSNVSGSVAVDTQALINARRHNELVYACIKIKADSATDPRLLVETRKNDREWSEDPGHPLRRLLMRPNPRMDEAAFMRAAIVSMDIANVFYAEKVRSGARAVVELWPLNPAEVKEKKKRNADGTEEITHYEWGSGRAKKDIKLEDMLVRKDWELGDPLSPLAVAMGSADADSAQTDFVRAFFNNAGVPSGILTIKGRSIDEIESQMIKAQWRAKYGRGLGHQHDIAVLDQNAEYQKIGAGLDELESETVRGITESRICMAFGVPPLIVYAYVGLLRATYSNLKEAWAGFWDATMSPLLKDWRAFFTWNLLTDFVDEELILAERLRLNWDLSQVAALQEDVDAVHKRERDALTAGAVTIDEYRAAIGKAPHPDKAVGAINPYLIRMVAGAVPTNGSAESAAALPAPSVTVEEVAKRKRKAKAGEKAPATNGRGNGAS